MFHRALFCPHFLPTVHKKSPFLKEIPYPLLGWWLHASLLIFFQFKILLKVITVLLAGRCRTIEFWCNYHFWLSRRNLFSLNSSNTQFLHLLIRHHLPDNYLLFSDNAQLYPSTIIILSLFSSQNLIWRLHNSFLTKLTSSRVDVRCCLRQFSTVLHLLSIYKDIVLPVWNMHLASSGEPLTHPLWTE